MRLKSLLTILLISSFSFAQRNASYASFNFLFGQQLLSYKSFDGKINSYNNYTPTHPVSYFGIGQSGYWIVNRGYEYCGHVNYLQIVPQKIKVNDSLSATITGFNFSIDAWGLNLLKKNKWCSVFLSAGAATGRLRFYGNSLCKQKNPYFCPKISLAPRFIIKRVCLQMQINYAYDISSKNWRRTYFSNSPKIDLAKTSMSGVCFLFGAGYALM